MRPARKAAGLRHGISPRLTCAAWCDPWRGFCVTDRRETALPAASLPGSRMDRIMWAVVDLVRRHWMFWLLLAGGLGLRGIAPIAYEPAPLFIDSKKDIFRAGLTATLFGAVWPRGYSL